MHADSYGVQLACEFRQLNKVDTASDVLYVSPKADIPLQLFFYPANSLWVDRRDFVFSGYDSNYIEFAEDSFSINVKSTVTGFYKDENIVITHKVTGNSCTFTLVVNPKAILLSVNAYNHENNSWHDHSSGINNIQDELTLLNYTSVVNIGDYTKAQVLEMLDNDDNTIFVSRSHGGPISVNGNVIGTQIGTKNNEDENGDKIYTSGANHYLSSTDITEYDLSNLKLAVFVACKTSYISDTVVDLPEAVVNAGCETAIGFTGTIKCYYANLWTQYLWEFLYKGYTISQACSMAKYDVNMVFNNDYDAGAFNQDDYEEGHGLDSYVIYGNDRLAFEW